MEIILNIILIAAVLVGGGAYWQAWKIIKKGKADEKLSENEVNELERRLNISQVCSYIAIAVMIIRIFLPLFFS